jgi:hypothetical protein
MRPFLIRQRSGLNPLKTSSFVSKLIRTHIYLNLLPILSHTYRTLSSVMSSFDHDLPTSIKGLALSNLDDSSPANALYSTDRPSPQPHVILQGPTIIHQPDQRKAIQLRRFPDYSNWLCSLWRGHGGGVARPMSAAYLGNIKGGCMLQNMRIACGRMKHRALRIRPYIITSTKTSVQKVPSECPC